MSALNSVRSAGLPVVIGVLASLPAFGLQVGTGGASTIDYLKQRGSKGYAYASYDETSLAAEESVGRTPAEDLAIIRTHLRPAVTDLAKALGVSRQAVYDWQAGKPIAPENANRLASLAAAADVLAREKLTTSGAIARRAIQDGKNLFDIVREGGSAERAAHQLVTILRREARQREVLQRRFAGRARPGPEVYDDLGTPMLDERN